MKYTPFFVFAASALVVSSMGTTMAYAEEPPASGAEYARRAQAAYDVQDWVGAIEGYRTAYEKEQKPEYLWALAQAQRQSGDYKAAMKSYQAFRRNATSTNQSTVATTMITECEAQLTKQQNEINAAHAEKPKEQPAPPAPVAAVPTTKDVAPVASGASPWWFIAGGVVSIGLGAATVWSGMDVRAKNADYEKAPTRDGYLDGRNRELRTNGLLIATGVSVVATAVLGAFGTDWSGGGQRAGQGSTEPVRLGVAPGPGGGAIVLGGAF